MAQHTMHSSPHPLRRPTDSAKPPRSYSTREVARLVELPPRRLREMARHGLVAGRRGRAGRFQYSFHDLVLLRNLRPVDDRLPKGRTLRLLCDLKQRLRKSRPLHTLRFAAWGRRLVVDEGQGAWDAETGQVLMDFQSRRVIRSQGADVVHASFRRPPDEPQDGDPEAWFDDADYHFEKGCRLEEEDPEGARQAYLQALEDDAQHVDCHLNLGRLLHESGDIEKAAWHYAKACELRPDDPTAFFNLGVANHDLGRHEDASNAYRQALNLDSSYADAHYNLSLLHRQLGDEVTALRHLKAYRWLMEGR